MYILRILTWHLSIGIGCLIVLSVSAGQPLNCGSNFICEQEKDAPFWRQNAQEALNQQLLKQKNQNIAKNVILFLGRGMSVPTITASRIYYGQQSGFRGDDSILPFEKFPYVGFAKTYCADAQVADSTCSGTAYLTGVKGNFYTAGLSPNVFSDDCAGARDPANQLESFISWAQRAGKATGIVGTTRVTHATLAGAYAHVCNRDFESDADVIERQRSPLECEDIASHLLRSPGNKLNVVFGGGRAKFTPKTECDIDGFAGERCDGVNLINEWISDKTGARAIFDRSELDDLDVENTQHVIGLFSPQHMAFNLDANRTKEPSLVTMTERAIQLLQKNPNGFVLFVENGLIDDAHHRATAQKALDETVEFAKAVERAQQLTDSCDTLIVVTADHAQTLSLSGYSERGRDILRLAMIPSPYDSLPYSILSYANGPGALQAYNSNGTRKNPRDIQFDKDYKYPSIVPNEVGTHGGEDVAIFATGPFAHLFVGVMEQNVIAHIIGYAACIGDGRTACD